jgi:hypothetical protein
MSEYLVEVTPGRELVYRTSWALRAAMRDGTITADSRIFHRATARWISITKHPEYRRYQADPPPWFDLTPVAQPKKAEDPEEPQEPQVIRRSGLLRRLAGLGAILPKRFGSKGTKEANAPKPTRTSPPSAANRWTFFG